MPEFLLGVVVGACFLGMVLLYMEWHREKCAEKERARDRIYGGPRAVPYTPDKPPEPCVNCRCELPPIVLDAAKLSPEEMDRMKACMRGLKIQPEKSREAQ